MYGPAFSLRWQLLFVLGFSTCNLAEPARPSLSGYETMILVTILSQSHLLIRSSACRTQTLQKCITLMYKISIMSINNNNGELPMAPLHGAPHGINNMLANQRQLLSGKGTICPAFGWMLSCMGGSICSLWHVVACRDPHAFSHLPTMQSVLMEYMLKRQSRSLMSRCCWRHALFPSHSRSVSLS